MFSDDYNVIFISFKWLQFTPLLMLRVTTASDMDLLLSVLHLRTLFSNWIRIPFIISNYQYTDYNYVKLDQFLWVLSCTFYSYVLHVIILLLCSFIFSWYKINTITNPRVQLIHLIINSCDCWTKQFNR